MLSQIISLKRGYIDCPLSVQTASENGNYFLHLLKRYHFKIFINKFYLSNFMNSVNNFFKIQIFEIKSTHSLSDLRLW